MKLDRNLPLNPRRGKYALIKLRVDTPVLHIGPAADGRHMRVNPAAVDFGDNPDTDFFVIRLKDKYAAVALAAYAMAAYEDDQEYGLEMLNLAKKAAEHPHKRRPD